MAGTVTVTLTDRCDLHGAGGAHLIFTVTGAKDMTVLAQAADLMGDPLNDEEAAVFIKGMVKLGKIGRTNAQLRNLFEAGVTVTI